MTERIARKKVAIQVRMLIIPKLGICKGMLMRKRIRTGPSILIPASMIKVPPSCSDNPLPNVAILINKNGEHPSPGSVNEYIGRRLDPLLKRPPEKSFKSKIKKLSPIIINLWKSMNVAETLCKDLNASTTY